MTSATISIIIPTLNEAANLPQTLPHARRMAGVSAGRLQLIVSDCGSRDGTPDVAAGLRATVVRGGTCRADALNRGAAVAHGPVLLFLHADTLLPAGFPSLIAGALDDPAVVGGAFDFEWGPHPLNRGYNRAALRLVTMVNRARFRWTKNFYGDQAVFARREVFYRVGGFPNVRLMEDVRFCRRMKQMGRTAILRPPVLTSPRRFVTRGVLRQFAQDLTLLAFEGCGLRPERLWDHYNRLNLSAH